MNDEILESRFQAIGQAVAYQVGGSAEGAFIYAEAKPGVMSQALFFDRGDYVEYVEVGEALSEALFDAWHGSEEGKEWAALCYTINGGEFDARFQYPDELSDAEWPEDRRDRILIEKYGDKPIKYPPPPSDAMER